MPKNSYRIVYYGAKGRGIQAHARSPGGLVYKEGQYTNELTGQLVPPGTHNNGMTLDLVRPDITDEPVVCQVYCKEKGN